MLTVAALHSIFIENSIKRTIRVYRVCIISAFFPDWTDQIEVNFNCIDRWKNILYSTHSSSFQKVANDFRAVEIEYLWSTLGATSHTHYIFHWFSSTIFP